MGDGAAAMSYYVYVYRNRNNVPVYVGKGRGNRAWEHLKPDSYLGYVHKLCRDAGKQFAPEIVAEFENEEDAYKLEAKLISEYGRFNQGTGTLLNLVAGRWMKKEWNTPLIEQIVHIKTKRRRPGKRNRQLSRELGVLV